MRPEINTYKQLAGSSCLQHTGKLLSGCLL